MPPKFHVAEAEEKMAQVGPQPPSSPRTRGIEFPAVKYGRRKEEAVARLREHNVPEILEGLLNKACKLNPDDLFGYMVSLQIMCCMLNKTLDIKRLCLCHFCMV